MIRRALATALALAALVTWAVPAGAAVTVMTNEAGVGTLTLTIEATASLSADPFPGVSVVFSPTTGTDPWTTTITFDASVLGPGEYGPIQLWITQEGSSTALPLESVTVDFPDPPPTTTTTTTSTTSTTTTTTTVPPTTTTTTTTTVAPTTTTTVPPTTTTRPTTTTTSTTSTTTTTTSVPETTTTTTEAATEVSSTQLTTTTSTTTTTLAVLGAQLTTTTTTLVSAFPPPETEPSSPWLLLTVGLVLAALVAGLGIGIPALRRRNAETVSAVRLPTRRRTVEYMRRRPPHLMPEAGPAAPVPPPGPEDSPPQAT